MTDVENILEKATIMFERDLDFNRVKEFLRLLSKKRNCTINYDYHRKGRIPEHPDDPEYDYEFSGMISSSDPFVVTTFSMIRNRDGNAYNRFQFFVTPGWNEVDYSKEELKFWEDTRKIAREYNLLRNQEIVKSIRDKQ